MDKNLKQDSCPHGQASEGLLRPPPVKVRAPSEVMGERVRGKRVRRTHPWLLASAGTIPTNTSVAF